MRCLRNEGKKQIRFCSIGARKEEGGVFYTIEEERCAIYLTLLGNGCEMLVEMQKCAMSIVIGEVGITRVWERPCLRQGH